MDRLSCSFNCGKGAEEVDLLIAGTSGYICNECIRLCAEILAEHPPTSTEGLLKTLAAETGLGIAFEIPEEEGAKVTTATVASACSGAPEPSKPAEDDLEELLADLVNIDAGDASAVDDVTAERLRALQARLERLRASSEAQKVRLAALEEEAAKRRARHVEKLSLGENLALAVLSVGLAAVASRRRKAKP